MIKIHLLLCTTLILFFTVTGCAYSKVVTFGPDGRKVKEETYYSRRSPLPDLANMVMAEGQYERSIKFTYTRVGADGNVEVPGLPIVPGMGAGYTHITVETGKSENVKK